MERIVDLYTEKLSEGVHLATDGDVQGLVARGRMATETLEIARDVTRQLLAAQDERAGPSTRLAAVRESLDDPHIFG